MMKMKKFVSVALTLVMALSLVACGGGGSEDAPAPDDSAPETSAPESSGNAVSTFKIGTIGPLTGDAAIYGQAVANGAAIAVQEINAAGGNIQFELKSEDDVADGETSVNAYNTLMDWGMQIMAGPTTSGSAAAAAAECAADSVFMLTPSASDAAVITAGDNIFQICFSDPNQGKASADYIFNNKLATKVGVIYDSSSAYSTGIYQTFKAQADTIGLNIETMPTHIAGMPCAININCHVTRHKTEVL